MMLASPRAHRGALRPALLAALVPLLVAGCDGAVTASPPDGGGTGGCDAADGQAVLVLRCNGCHSVNVTGAARGGAPVGVDFDTTADVRRWNDRIRVRTLEQKTMPPGAPLPACEGPLLDAYLVANAATACTPSCTGRVCGSDGCGGTCGPGCGATQNCTAAGQCEAACTPNCTGKQCGPDGCGGTCGNGCAGTLTCNTNTGQCSANCTPSCTGRTCGDDGCGGACAPGCGAGTTCSQGTCTSTTKSYAADVHPLWVKYDCAGSGCHGGARPAESLNLSSASTGYGELVGVSSTQCTGKKLVVASDLAGSYLYNKVTGLGLCFGSKMPKGGGLTPGELDTVRLWIESGARP